MSDINLSMKSKSSTLYMYYCTVNPSNNDERHDFNLLMKGLTYPVVTLTCSNYITPSRSVILTASSVLLTYGVLMYQIFPDFFKSTVDWAG